MCGRVVLDTDEEALYRHYGIERPDKIIIARKTEVFPTDMHPVVLLDQSKDIRQMKWGFTPTYVKKPLINARVETIDEKATFKEAFATRRCIIPVTAFFEWKAMEKKKIKYKISIEKTSEESQDEIFSLAGIYSTFKYKDEYVEEFTIITTDANEQLKEIHNRMPVIISEAYEKKWLDNSMTKEELRNFTADSKIRMKLMEQKA